MMLAFNQVTGGYPGGFQITDIDLTLEAGAMLGIVGPNGCGKTTLLRVASRALRPSRGEVRVDGQNLWHLRPKDTALKVAVVSQMTDALSMTVGEYVLLGRIPHYARLQFLDSKVDQDAAREAMRLTDCERLADHPMSAISGGERQLALIARALAQQPRLLLLDEPTTFLDIAHQVRVLDLIRRLNRELGLTVMMVLHDLNAASEYCERLILMHAGRIRVTGAPEAVLDYRVLEEVYQTVVVVGRNAASGRPCVFPVSEAVRQSSGAGGEGRK